LLFAAGSLAAATAVQKLFASPSTAVEFTTLDHHRGAMKWLAELDDHAISYTDAISFTVMEASRCEIALSFDDDFAVARFTLLQLEMFDG
jgi:predicted nucleic acid-binding protein